MPKLKNPSDPYQLAAAAAEYLHLSFMDPTDMCYADLESCEWAAIRIIEACRAIKEGRLGVTETEVGGEATSLSLRLQE